MSNESFNFNKFIKDSIETITRPKEYFAALTLEGGLGEPVIKAVLYGIVAGIFTLIWSFLKIGAVAGGMFGGAIGIMAFIWAIIGAIIGLFIGAVIMLIISAVCGGSTDFEANLRVTASMMVLMPVSAFFGFFSGLNFWLGFLITMVIYLFGLYLMYFALTGSLKGKSGISRIVTIALAALVVLFMLIGMGAKRTANKYLREYGIETEEGERNFDQMAKDMEEALKELQEEGEKK
ncbi:MAG: YIP1 family protein [Bacteroidales bacterium]|nr:YIP1 family protein [Bacteroidales bacterium]